MYVIFINNKYQIKVEVKVKVSFQTKELGQSYHIRHSRFSPHVEAQHSIEQMDLVRPGPVPTLARYRSVMLLKFLHFHSFIHSF